MKKDVFPRKK
uniref:Uncharacterized protein n=1 Tax=Rhizophora mucronata TaxID=61149 RepID=A0A2P2PYD4_RHIMU